MKSCIEDADLWLNSSNENSKKTKMKITMIFLFFAQICNESSKAYEDDEDDEEEGGDNKKVNFDMDMSNLVIDESHISAAKGPRKIINVS